MKGKNQKKSNEKIVNEGQIVSNVDIAKNIDFEIKPNPLSYYYPKNLGIYTYYCKDVLEGIVNNLLPIKIFTRFTETICKENSGFKNHVLSYRTFGDSNKAVAELFLNCLTVNEEKLNKLLSILFDDKNLYQEMPTDTPVRKVVSVYSKFKNKFCKEKLKFNYKDSKYSIDVKDIVSVGITVKSYFSLDFYLRGLLELIYKDNSFIDTDVSLYSQHGINNLKFMTSKYVDYEVMLVLKDSTMIPVSISSFRMRDIEPRSNKINTESEIEEYWREYKIRSKDRDRINKLRYVKFGLDHSELSKKQENYEDVKSALGITTFETLYEILSLFENFSSNESDKDVTKPANRMYNYTTDIAAEAESIGRLFGVYRCAAYGYGSSDFRLTTSLPRIHSSRDELNVLPRNNIKVRLTPLRFYYTIASEYSETVMDIYKPILQNAKPDDINLMFSCSKEFGLTHVPLNKGDDTEIKTWLIELINTLHNVESNEKIVFEEKSKRGTMVYDSTDIFLSYNPKTDHIDRFKYKSNILSIDKKNVTLLSRGIRSTWTPDNGYRREMTIEISFTARELISLNLEENEEPKSCEIIGKRKLVVVCDVDSVDSFEIEK